MSEIHYNCEGEPPKALVNVAERLHLCVEACKGLSDAQVREMRKWWDFSFDGYADIEKYKELRRLRDDVIEAAKEYILRPTGSSGQYEVSKLYGVTRALLVHQKASGDE